MEELKTREQVIEFLKKIFNDKGYSLHLDKVDIYLTDKKFTIIGNDL